MSNEIGPYSTATEMLAALDDKRSARSSSSTCMCVASSERDGELNAIPVRTPERALRGGPVSRQARAGGERAPLLGLPMTLKESTQMAGLPQSAGIEPLKDYRPAGDGPIAQQRVRRGRVPARQDQHPGRARRLAGRQPGLRTHEQSVGSRAHAGRQHRWRRRGARRRHDAARDRQRHRRLDPRARGLLRCVRPSPVGDGSSAHGVVPARPIAEPGDRDGSAGAAGAQRDRPRAAVRRRRRPGASAKHAGVAARLPAARGEQLSDFRVAVMPPLDDRCSRRPRCRRRSTSSRVAVARRRESRRGDARCRPERVLQRLLDAARSSSPRRPESLGEREKGQRRRLDPTTASMVGDGDGLHHRRGGLLLRAASARDGARRLALVLRGVGRARVPDSARRRVRAPDRSAARSHAAASTTRACRTRSTSSIRCGRSSPASRRPHSPPGSTRAGLPLGLQAIGPYLEDRTTMRFAQCLEREWYSFEPPPGY